MWARGRCRISPPRFLAECCKRQLNQGSFVLLYFRLFTFSDLYWVCLSVFSCTVLFVSISQVIGCEDRLRNDLYCVEWGVELYSNQNQSLYVMDLCRAALLTNCFIVQAHSKQNCTLYSTTWHAWCRSRVLGQLRLNIKPVWTISGMSVKHREHNMPCEIRYEMLF